MGTNSETQESKRNLEAVKWIIVVVLLITSIIINYFFQGMLPLLRMLLVAIVIATAGGVALLTTKGKEVIAFAREARSEVRKVIWPTHQETLYTTLVVAVVTITVSVILWGLDGILVRLVSFITGLRF